MMNRLFGRRPPRPTLTDAVQTTEQRCAVTEEKLRRCEAELASLAKQVTAGGATAARARQQALAVLRRKRLYEGHRERLQQQAFNMEQTVMALDELKGTTATMMAMKDASKTFQRQQVRIEALEALRDEVEDLLYHADEVNHVLAQPYESYGLEALDEAALDAELDALAEQTALGTIEADKLNETDVPSYLPAEMLLDTSLNTASAEINTERAVKES